MTDHDEPATVTGNADPHSGEDPARVRFDAFEPARTVPHVELTDEQRAVVELGAGHGPVLILGAPGTGRTTAVLEAVVRRIDAGLNPESVLMLAPTRSAASRLRDGLSERLAAAGRGTRSSTPVRTWASYAFDLIRRARLAGPLAHLARPPRLLSGAEQDTLIGELLESYEAGLLPAPPWPTELLEAVPTRGFRREVRELVDRMSEFGVEPGDLQALGGEHGRPEWEAAAVLLQDYRDRLDLGMAEAFDPAGLISTAVRLLSPEEPTGLAAPDAIEEFARAERERIELIVVDDLQEATPAMHELLAVLGHEADVLLAAAPDTTVQGFRGARPDLVGQVLERLGGGRTHRLTRGFRMHTDVHAAWARVARRLGAGFPEHARALHEASAVPAEESEPAAFDSSAHVLASLAHEDQFVLQRVLQVHHDCQVPLDDIAVLARTGARVAGLARFLEGQGVPVRHDSAGTVLKDEPAVAPLLRLLRLVVDLAVPTEHDDAAPGVRLSDVLDAGDVDALLRGRYGAMTALHVRRLRQDLLTAERARGGRRSSAELLVQALVEPDIIGPETERHHGLQRLSRMLHAGLAAASAADATAETVLWALWSAAERGQAWRRTALGRTAFGRSDRPDAGREARRADADLDAVVALFELAERYVDQFPGSRADAFSTYMESQDLPMDSLARGSAGWDAVHVLTPATAAGRQWHTVIVVGVQDGVWPNTRLRGQLLGATDLVDLVGAGPGQEWPTPHRARMAEVRRDELRSFAAAVSRARRTVLGTAVADADTAPSEFLELIGPVPRHRSGGYAHTHVPPALTSSAAVARLRAVLEQDHARPAMQADGPGTGESITPDEAAAGLAWLAAQGVRAADPEHWWGLGPLSTDAPLVPLDESGRPTEPVRLSPSRVQTLLENPLDWFVSLAGGDQPATTAQQVGVLVHSIAEHHPQGPAEAVRAELTRRLAELALPPGWTAEATREDLRHRVESYVRYLDQADLAGRRSVGEEVRVDVVLADETVPVRIVGVIDRLEVDAAGRPIVVDLKTGTTPPTAAELPRLPQLAAYQVAVRAGALDGAEHRGGLVDPHEPAGARLVQLGAANRSEVKEQPQDPITTADDWAPRQVVTAAARSLGPRLLVLHDGPGPCRNAALCPLCAQGREVTEWTR